MSSITLDLLEITVGLEIRFYIGATAYNKLVSFMNGKFHGEVF